MKDLENDESMTNYLKQQNISNLSYDDLVYDANKTYEEWIEKLKIFANWFRNEFPYYHGSCESCGNVNCNSFAGVMAPSQQEKTYRAGVVETYVCGNCSYFTRFPRFNDVSVVLQTKRGRCGEYSALIVRMLKALKYDTRWVADISDHVSTPCIYDHVHR